MDLKKYQESARRIAEKQAAKTKPLIPPEAVSGMKALDPSMQEGQTFGDTVDAAAAVANAPQVPRAKLSPETQEGLAAIREAAEAERNRIEKEEEKVSVVTNDEDPESLEADRLMNLMNQDAINNSSQRKTIESKLDPIDLGTALLSGEFRQTVPINDYITVTFRSVTAFEFQEVRKLLWDWSKEDLATETMADEVYSNMILTCSIINFCGKEIGSQLDKKPSVAGVTYEFNREAFEKKYRMISHLPSQVLWMLTVHSQWFDQRVRALLKVSELKSG